MTTTSTELKCLLIFVLKILPLWPISSYIHGVTECGESRQSALKSWSSQLRYITGRHYLSVPLNESEPHPRNMSPYQLALLGFPQRGDGTDIGRPEQEDQVSFSGSLCSLSAKEPTDY